MRCVIVDDDDLTRAVLQRYVEQHGDLELVASCASGAEAARVLRHQAVDLLYLDVEMPEMSGLELVRSLDVQPQVILVTSNASYAVEAFELEVTDFLLKPIGYPQFLRATGRALRRGADPATAGTGGASSRHLFVRYDGRLTKLDLTDVLRVEAKGDTVLVHTTKRPYLVTATMKAIEGSLPADDFVRVHRSHIVRIDRIVDIEETNLVVGRDIVPIGPSYRPALLRRLRTL
jgi:two-component system, LytTR family, response regulator